MERKKFHIATLSLGQTIPIESSFDNEAEARALVEELTVLSIIH
jgi:hypothetical protein